MKPALIFDYDGTIHNTLHIYEPSFRRTFKWLVDEGYTEYRDISSERIASWLGINSVDMWNSFLPDLPDDIKAQASAMTGQGMTERILSHQASWYEGATEVLDALKADDYEMYVLSNCKIAYRDANMKEFGMDRWFKDFIACESYGFAPKTEIIKKLSPKINAPLIIIGDRDKDIECAKACNGVSIGCLYGYGSEEELSNADYLIKDIREIINCISDNI